MKVCIASSRPIGQKCKDWASENLPPEFELTDSLEEAEVVVSVLYDSLFSAEFINSKQACFNFHPGLLPYYRGAGAYSWVIINQEKHTGVTLHEIDRDIDHGKIIDRQAFAISPEDTAEQLFSKAMDLLFEMFKFWLRKLLVKKYTFAGYQSDSHGRNKKVYYRKDLEGIKDLTKYVKAFTFAGKENAYFINAHGKKVYLDYYA